ncbi:DUF397 domain-containing protein [Streptomyces sp. J2-1]|uniref:DUF397 domain-containing protein n=1 Tax=Streptomyces corallincola TaxID=2851888 RepID=UPI001C38C0AA|nr:DUF397 domain-containing protein [Streptomyces corallincola]MBV2357452.1 DUF397 domain-containing protein [Streptomyces corallincola]
MIHISGQFRKSSYSALEGNCVEVADTADQGHAVRDSKTPAGPVLLISRAGWNLFLGQLKQPS